MKKMKKWSFEELRFIEVDGEVYIRVEDFEKSLEELRKILEGGKNV